jgi:hypothetical protein
VREFQRSAVRVADVTAGEHVILQQCIDPPAVRLGMIFEHDRVEIERRHAGENIVLGTFGVDLHDLRLGQDVRCPRLDLDGSRRLLADIVEARLTAIVATKVEPGQARVADREVLKAHRASRELGEVSGQRREIVGKRLMAVDVGPRPALEGPGREYSRHWPRCPGSRARCADKESHIPRPGPSGRGCACSLDTRCSSRPCVSRMVGGDSLELPTSWV